MVASRGSSRATRLLCQLSLPFCLFIPVMYRSQMDLKAYINIANHPSFLNPEAVANQSHVGDNVIQTPQPLRYAYAFLVAGCDPDNPTYRSFLYNILVAIYSLWSAGSKAEYVILVQMAANTKHHELPMEDLALFSKFSNRTKVHIHYLPKPVLDSFYQAMMRKFTILNITRYSRVFFLDADIMPLCNLDYFFDLSERGILKENVVLAGETEPANAGFFMLRPDAADYKLLLSIIQRHHVRALQNTTHAFDLTTGWGHAIEPPDEWVTLRNRGRLWLFHGYFADQGLLYHWVKYVKRHVSIIIYDTIQDWVIPPSHQLNDADISPVLEFNASSTSIPDYGCSTRFRFFPRRRPPPYRDFVHFSGSSKPWERSSIPDDLDDPKAASWPFVLWFHWLRKVNRELQLNINISTILNLRMPSLGRYPVVAEMVELARAEANITSKRKKHRRDALKRDKGKA